MIIYLVNCAFSGDHTISNMLKVMPSYFWAPWISPHSLAGAEVYNTEYVKATNANAPSDVVEEVERDLTEVFLLDLMTEGKVRKNTAIQRVEFCYYLSPVKLCLFEHFW